MLAVIKKSKFFEPWLKQRSEESLIGTEKKGRVWNKWLQRQKEFVQFVLELSLVKILM